MYQFVSGRSSELSKLMGEFDSLMTQLQNTQGQGPGLSKQPSHPATDGGGSRGARDAVLPRSIPQKVATAPGPGPQVVSTLSHPSLSHRSSTTSASASHFAAYDDNSMHPLPSSTATTTATTHQKHPHGTNVYPYPYPTDTESPGPGPGANRASLGPGTDDTSSPSPFSFPDPSPSPNASMEDLQLIDTLKVTGPTNRPTNRPPHHTCYCLPQTLTPNPLSRISICRLPHTLFSTLTSLVLLLLVLPVRHYRTCRARRRVPRK